MAERRLLLIYGIHSNSFIPYQKVSIAFSHYFIFSTARLEISIYL